MVVAKKSKEKKPKRERNDDDDDWDGAADPRACLRLHQLRGQG